MWIGGDSMASEVGQSLSALGIRRDHADAPCRHTRRVDAPDDSDWPAHPIDVVNQQNPEVMVVMFEANDAEKMKLDGKVYDVSSPEWQAEYRRRVDAVMTFLTQGGKRHTTGSASASCAPVTSTRSRSSSRAFTATKPLSIRA